MGLVYSLVLKIREHFLTVIRERCDDGKRVREVIGGLKMEGGDQQPGSMCCLHKLGEVTKESSMKCLGRAATLPMSLWPRFQPSQTEQDLQNCKVIHLYHLSCPIYVYKYTHIFSQNNFSASLGKLLDGLKTLYSS